MLKKKQRLIFACLISILILNFAFINMVYAQETEVITLNLEESIKMGWKRNSSLQQMKARLDAAKAAIEQSEAALKPGLSLNSSYTRSKEKSLRTGSKDSFNHQLNLNYLLYRRPVELKVDQSRTQWQKLKKQYESQKNNLSYRITQSYYQLLKAESLVKVTKESLRQVEEHLKIAKAHFKAGNTLKTDVLQTKVRKSEVQEQLLQAENNLQLSRERLKNLLEIDANKEIRLESNIDFLNTDLSLQEALNFALDNRADLSSLQYDIKKAYQGVELAEKGDDPNLSFVGSLVKNGSDFIPNDYSWQAMVNLEWPLYDGNKNDALVKQAEANLRANKSILHQKKQNIELEVRESFLNLEVNEKQMKTAQERLQVAKENLRLAELRYEEGVATNAEVIDAQVALAKAKTNYQKRSYNYKVSQAGVLKTIGLSYISAQDSEF